VDKIGGAIRLQYLDKMLCVFVSLTQMQQTASDMWFSPSHHMRWRGTNHDDCVDCTMSQNPEKWNLNYHHC